MNNKNSENWEKALSTRKRHLELKKEEIESRLGEKRRLTNNMECEEKQRRVERRRTLDTWMYMELHSMDENEVWALVDMTETLTVYGKFHV